MTGGGHWQQAEIASDEQVLLPTVGITGDGWRSLAMGGDCLWQAGIAGDSRRLLAVGGDNWRWVEIAGDGWRLLATGGQRLLTVGRDR